MRKPADVSSPVLARDVLVLLRDAHRRLDAMGVPPAPPRPLVERPHEEIAA